MAHDNDPTEAELQERLRQLFDRMPPALIDRGSADPFLNQLADILMTMVGNSDPDERKAFRKVLLATLVLVYYTGQDVMATFADIARNRDLSKKLSRN